MALQERYAPGDWRTMLADRLDPPRVDHGNDQFPTPGALERHIDPKGWHYPHLDLIDDHLLRLERRELDTRGLMIFMQPRAGKSRRCSRVFPTWYLRRHPEHQIVLGTYGLALGAGHSRWVRNTIRTRPNLGLRLSSDSQRVDEWQLAGHEGGMKAIGVGGGITGRGANLLVLDDPVKNREEAESQVMRDKTWNWWTDDLSTRLTKSDDLEPVVLLMMTRWHEDDLAGRLLMNEPHNWTVLTLPALAEAGDPLGRQVDEVLMADRYGDDWMAEQRSRLGSYSFSALYQQRPAPAEGAFFRRPFKYWQADEDDAGNPLWLLDTERVNPEHCWRFATVDLAASIKTSADWTVMSTWAVTPNRDLILLDRVRRRLEERNHFGVVKEQAEKHRLTFVGVESRMFGTTLVYEMGRWAKVPVRELVADVDKLTRAIPAQARLEAGRVWWPQGVSWLEEWESELLSFPNGVHDDQVDTFSYAALLLAQGRKGRVPAVPLDMSPEARVARHIEAKVKDRKRRRTRAVGG